MKILFYIVLAILILLSVSSGATKIILMQHDVDFFSQYGFTNPLLIGFGVTQLLGALLLVLPKTRIIGTAIIAITFLISAIILFIASNIPMAIVTLIFILLLGFVAKQSSAMSDDAST